VIVASLALNVALVALLAGLWAWRALRPDAFDLQRQVRRELFGVLRSPASSPEVVMVGDSLVHFGEWWELLGRPAANRGISGDRLADVRARLPDVVALRPRSVVLAVGVNDLARGAAPEEVAAGLADLARGLRDALPATRVLVHGLLPARDDPSRPGLEGRIRRVNDLVRPRVEALGLAYVDPAPLAVASGALDRRFSADGLHLSAAGYARWGELVRQALARP
jgi:lysophospholipase L1-like esterase